MIETPQNAASVPHDPSTEMASRRTGMAFQRTRLAADRTLMAVIRTSLSLISFGFTIHKMFDSLKESHVIEHAGAARNFGGSLLGIGMVVLLMGIIYHAWFMRALRRQRTSMGEEGLVHGESPFPPSTTLVAAVLLFALGLLAAINMIFRNGPYG